MHMPNQSRHGSAQRVQGVSTGDRKRRSMNADKLDVADAKQRGDGWLT